MSAEIVMWAANVTGLVSCAVPWRGRARRIRHLALLAPVAAVVQLSAGGYRWPLVPAYALAAAIAVGWLLGAVRPGRPAWWFRATGTATGVAVFAVSVATPIAVPVFRLPEPGGPYAIGTTTYHWRDDARREIFDPDPAARRELMAQIWYPAEPTANTADAPYVTDSAALSAAAGPMLGAPGFVFDFWDAVPTHATRRPPVASGRSRYPVLIFASGLDAFRQSNMFQVERLVSHGFVVVGLDQPYTSAATVFPDGRTVTGWTKDRVYPAVQQSITPTVPAPGLGYAVLPDGLIPYLARDISSALDRLARLDDADPAGLLTGRLDLGRAGAFGVSLGAMTVGAACHADPRLRACSMMDAAMTADVVRDGLRQPGMWLTRDAESILLERDRSGGWPDREITETLDTQRAVFAASPPGRGYHVVIPGMFHLNFTDAPSWTPLAQRLGMSGPIGGARGHEIVAAYTLAFFDRFLGDDSATLLDDPPPWREVHIERR
ncbi:alpha/beta hydrolase family protein [Nocardia sp. NPDC001965]